MYPNKGWFETYEQVDRGIVLLGNNKSCTVVGIGSLRHKMYNGRERVLNDVRHVSKLKRNMISLGILYRCDQGNLEGG